MSIDGFFKEKIAEQKKNNILIIDFLVYRCIFTAANEYEQQKRDFMVGSIESLKIKTEREMYGYWKHLVLNNVFSSVLDKKPNQVVIAVDGKNNWRKEIYNEYKSQRKAARDKSNVDFNVFYPIMEEFINNLEQHFKCFRILRVPRCEADDIIAVLSKRFCKDENNLVELISTDKDFVQLQRYKNFKQYNPIKKMYIKSMNPDKDLEIKILTGDKSDNIPAVKNRVGPKTAEKMINNGLTDLEDPIIKEAYIRNRQLIDFEQIPNDIVESVKKYYDNITIGKVNVNNVWQWLVVEELNKLSDDWSMVAPQLKNLT